MTHVSLFAGIGGIDIAAEWAGFRTIVQVERNPYCLKVLEKHWPDVHRCREIRDFPDQDYGAVTLVSGGFPCQPFSAAGKRRGKEDDRYLWPEMLRVIHEVKPSWVLAENVPGILSLEQGLLFEYLLNDLEVEGYQTWTGLIPASGVGANHRRERVFVVGHAECLWITQSQGGKQDKRRRTINTGQDVADARRSGRIQPEESRRETGERDRNGHQDAANTDKQHGNNGGYGASEVCREQRKEAELSRSENASNAASRSTESSSTQCYVGAFQDETMREIRNSDNWATEPNVGRVAHGVPKRVDRLRALGNAVVPQQVYPIFEAIAKEER